MAFGKKTKNIGKKSDFKGKKGVWKKLGSVLKSEKFGGCYFSSDGYHGALLFLDKETESLYLIKGGAYTDRKALQGKGVNVPAFVEGTLSVNLDNEKVAIKVNLDELESLSDLFEEDEDSEE